ncbi:HAD-IA family hydrolase [Xanthomonas cannabis]|uniref:HAD-IA family hydrolase n=1 Tax=Xanthomonas cannabis TaxID=1885674 RepID=UPI000574171C|nr:HAD-IA family hydrolase [Xanthomonas cannabis]KHL52548.1 hydrolase [Xanthomonas cannabis pv. cannabis]KHL54065.1 hydrolase [Xanthomonas cannabis pv. cannabis]MCC8442742.1 HAD-IA family hydrolase [Xanthomonas cannabis]
MPPAPPSLLLLDFDGVLAHYARPRRMAALAAAAGCTPQRVHEVLFVQGLERAYDAGTIDTQAYLAQLSQGLGHTIDRATWLAARVAACRADPSVVAQVLAVPATTAVAVLTNNGPLMMDAIERIVPPLFPLLQGRVLCSGALGGRKPDVQVYQRALAQLGERAERTLFVDDLFVNVRGARAAGLHADTVRDARALRRVLKRHGLE